VSLTPLDYPTQATAGSLIVRRSGDTLSITVPPSLHRTFQGTGVYLLGTIAAIVMGAVWWFWPNRNMALLAILPMLTWIVGALSVLPLVTAMFLSRFPAEVTIANGELTITGRRLREVSRWVAPAASIVDIRLDRFRPVNNFVRCEYVTLRYRDGRDHPLHRGTREERIALMTILREALNLPPDPLHRERYRPPPRWSRLRIQYWPDGVWIHIVPRPVNWLLNVIAIPIIAPIAWWIVICLSTGKWELRWEAPGSMEPYVHWMLTVLATAGALVAVNITVYRLARRSVISLRGLQVQLVETGYSTPINATWHLAKLVGIGEYRRRVVLRFEGEGDVMIRQRLRRAEREWLRETLKSARLLQAAPPSVPPSP
jgi:hypothetical protein